MRQWLMLLATVAPLLVAQEYLPQGSIFGGARVGLGAKRNAFNVGVDGEYVLTKPDEAGPGIVTVGLSLDFSRYSEEKVSQGQSATQTTTVIPVTLCGVYHFSPTMAEAQSAEFDPYILAGIAYRFQTATSTIKQTGVELSTSMNDVILVGGLGAWYFFTPQLAAHLRLAFGASFVTVGIVYRFF